ncbi:glycosyltransferase [Bacillus thuringiensis]|uniref:oligosaccharide flippase family protein n=2 Tax=Bacillus thuringiensis TaxID=1428 RepID=UPI000BED9FC1|nr:oligosaccharide flippase family protein [Bacillus thuringiensis]MEB9403808.1 oligosaccharide flippase family protein [Bacillus cereus]MEB9554716.1 oligosaccharide flippase family protein [Bacillus cereus]PEB88260.1 glycosyltransferase [Bacillus thuringiensis]PFJ61688.1 glycosyltransferase [Bacillus thuringiensis]PFQ88126.1 glycosyltransferase [Bacillus thuringiensis]
MKNREFKVAISIKNKFIKILKMGAKVGFFHLLSANILLQIAGFGGQIFLTRVLSIEDIGRIRVLQSFLSVLLIIATLGMNTTILKFCSEDILKKEKHTILKASIFVSMIISIIVMIFTVIAAFLGLLSNDEILNQQMVIYILQVPFLVLNSLGMAYLQSQQRIKTMSNLQSFTKIFILLASTACAFIFGLMGYVIALVVSTSVTSCLLFLLLKEDIKQLISLKIEKVYINKILKFGGYTFGTGLLWQLILSSGIIIANYTVQDGKQIAYYGTAQLIINTLMMVPITLNQIMIPYISKKSNDLEEVQKIALKYQLRMFFLMLIVGGMAYYIIPIIIPWAFGEAYVKSIPYFKVLLLGLIFWSMYSPKNNILYSIGKVKYTFYANFIMCIINIVLNIILVKRYEIMGIAISSTLTFLIAIGINYFYYKKALIKDKASFVK